MSGSDAAPTSRSKSAANALQSLGGAAIDSLQLAQRTESPSRE